MSRSTTRSISFSCFSSTFIRQRPVRTYTHTSHARARAHHQPLTPVHLHSLSLALLGPSSAASTCPPALPARFFSKPIHACILCVSFRTYSLAFAANFALVWCCIFLPPIAALFSMSPSRCLSLSLSQLLDFEALAHHRERARATYQLRRGLSDHALSLDFASELQNPSPQLYRVCIGSAREILDTVEPRGREKKRRERERERWGQEG